MTIRNEDEVCTTSPPMETAATHEERPVEPQPARSEVEVAEEGAGICYANFCRVTGTPEELILDFGLNSQPFGAPSRIDVKQRLVVNYYTAKRLLQALGMSIQRHEAAFGVLETDVQKRITPGVRRISAGG